MTSNLKMWIENGAPDKGDLEEDSYRILRHFFMQKEGRLYRNRDGIVACKRREADKVLYKYNAIVLPQLYQTELLFRSHDQMGHQGIDKRILKRFEWPGLKKACGKWDAMMEQDAVHIGYEADVTAHLLDTNERKSESQGFWTQER